jgi:hypothetical protein
MCKTKKEASVHALTRPVGAHLVGSIPLADTATVFRKVSAQLGPYLRRMPDGETGARAGFIGWQIPAFLELVALAQRGAAAGAPMPPLGYAAAALAAYPVFAQLREEGVIPLSVRFQVSLPTPVALVHALVEPADQPAVEALHTAQLRAELNTILAAIPHAALAIQWDTPIEFAILEGVMPTAYVEPQAAIFERLLHWGDWVPADVELGYHLCYGDDEGKHFKEPADTALLVAVANHLAAHLERPLQWIHMPVPQGRDDAAYFAALAGLRLRPESELYLGLIHLADGVAGAERRIAAARPFVADFGVATECGMGRRPPATIPDLLALHATVAEPRL